MHDDETCPAMVLSSNKYNTLKMDGKGVATHGIASSRVPVLENACI